MKKTIFKLAANALWAALITVALTSVSWQVVRGKNFADLGNYYQQTETGQTFLENRSNGTLVEKISNEVLWRYLISSWIEREHITPELAFGAISASTIFIYVLFVAWRSGRLSTILLLNPLVIDFAFSQMRMAFAVSLVLIGLMSRSRILLIFLAIISVFIHTAMPLLILMYVISSVFCRKYREGKISKRALLCTLFFVGVIVAFVIGPLRAEILSYVGDRRADNPDLPSSFMFLLPWIAFLAYLFKQSESYFRSSINCFSLVALSVVAGNLLWHGYSTRILAASFALLMVSLYRTRPELRLIALTIFASYAAIQWLFWL